jgi:hypothetical protein
VKRHGDLMVWIRSVRKQDADERPTGTLLASNPPLADEDERINTNEEQVMRAVSTLTLSAALLLTGIAFAQAPPPNTTEDASAAAKAAPESPASKSSSPADVSPSATTDGSHASAHASAQTCGKQASDQKLTGVAKTDFVRNCKAGKAATAGN